MVAGFDGVIYSEPRVSRLTPFSQEMLGSSNRVKTFSAKLPPCYRTKFVSSNLRRLKTLRVTDIIKKTSSIFFHPATERIFGDHLKEYNIIFKSVHETNSRSRK